MRPGELGKKVYTKDGNAIVFKRIGLAALAWSAVGLLGFEHVRCEKLYGNHDLQDLHCRRIPITVIPRSASDEGSARGFSVPTH